MILHRKEFCRVRSVYRIIQNKSFNCRKHKLLSIEVFFVCVCEFVVYMIIAIQKQSLSRKVFGVGFFLAPEESFRQDPRQMLLSSQEGKKEGR